MGSIFCRHVGSIISSAVVVALVTAIPSRAGVRPDTILSIVLQGDHTVVSTSIGLREKTNDAKGWSVMPLPPGMRPGGCFDISDVDASPLYYSPPVRPAPEWASGCMPGLGLWMTADFGRTWIQVDRAHIFSSVLVHRSGVIYAIGRTAEEVPDPAQAMFKGGSDLLSSTDEGRTWTVIPGSRFWTLHLLKCAINPDHVCADAFGAIREYRVEYVPVLKKLTLQASWLAELSDEEYLRPGTGTGTSPCCYQLLANLENYVHYPFHSSISLPGLRFFTEAERYKFHVGEPVSVRAAIELMPVDPPLQSLELPDVDSTLEFWGVKYIEPGGKRVFEPEYPKLQMVDLVHGGVPHVDPMVTTATAHILKVGQPYRKEIDLSRLMSFDKPGLYRVQLTFNNSTAFKRNDAQWTGFFSGETFSIEIEP